jgi:hypothetical protein
MIRLAQPGAPRPPASISDLAWLEGFWIGDMPQGPVEHVILGPKFGHMPSFVRAVNATGVFFYEISLFAEERGSLVNKVKHFTSDLHGWEARDASIDRPLLERRGDTFFFDGLTLQRTGPDAFTVYFLVKMDGVERETLELPFRRRKAGV